MEKKSLLNKNMHLLAINTPFPNSKKTIPLKQKIYNLTINTLHPNNKHNIP